MDLSQLALVLAAYMALLPEKMRSGLTVPRKRCLDTEASTGIRGTICKRFGQNAYLWQGYFPAEKSSVLVAESYPELCRQANLACRAPGALTGPLRRTALKSFLVPGNRSPRPLRLH